MDEKRDKIISGRSLHHLSRFIDGRKLQTEAFGENKMGERAYRRAERIVLALTLLTNHLDHEDVFRRRIRSRGVRLLASILEARFEMRSVGSSSVDLIKIYIREIISMIRMLGIAGSISPQNGEIIIEALDELGGFIGLSQRSILSDTIQLSKSDLSDVQSETVIIKDVMDKKDIKDKLEMQENVLYKTPKHEPRSAGILEALREAAPLSIREIAVHFPEYSEKMIQRELADLVSRGMVKKIGFKRWSKYALPSLEPISS